MRRFRVSAVCFLPALIVSGISQGANAPCVDNAIVIQAAFNQTAAKHFYMECAVVKDGYHPFLVKLPAARRALVTARLKEPAAQTLACTADPRDPARTGLVRKEMIVLASCKPARVGEIWTLP